MLWHDQGLPQAIDDEGEEEKRGKNSDYRGGKDVTVPVKLPKRILFLGQKAAREMRHKQESPNRPLEKSLAPVGFMPTWIVTKKTET